MSCDTALGLPYNLANTALLAHLVAHAAGLKPGHLAWTGNDVHVYEPHLETLVAQISRPAHQAPTLEITAPVGTDPWNVEPDQVLVKNYASEPSVKYELFVG